MQSCVAGSEQGASKCEATRQACTSHVQKCCVEQHFAGLMQLCLSAAEACAQGVRSLGTTRFQRPCLSARLTKEALNLAERSTDHELTHRCCPVQLSCKSRFPSTLQRNSEHTLQLLHTGASATQHVSTTTAARSSHAERDDLSRYARVCPASALASSRHSGKSLASPCST